MNFIEAVKKLKEGYKITKDCWDKENYIYLEGHWVVFDEEEEVHNFSFYDYLYEGWKIYLKERKLHTFEEALKALKEGKTIKRKQSTAEFYYNYTSNTITSNLPYQPEKYDGDKWVDISFTNDDILANDWIIVEGKE